LSEMNISSDRCKRSYCHIYRSNFDVFEVPPDDNEKTAVDCEYKLWIS
jgi:hypothetical protein